VLDALSRNSVGMFHARSEPKPRLGSWANVFGVPQEEAWHRVIVCAVDDDQAIETFEGEPEDA